MLGLKLIHVSKRGQRYDAKTVEEIENSKLRIILHILLSKTLLRQRLETGQAYPRIFNLLCRDNCSDKIVLLYDITQIIDIV